MPIYLFFGDEEYLLDKEIENLKKTVLNNDVNSLNYARHDNPDGKTVQEILLSNPLLFGNSLHLIKLNKTLLGNKKGAISESEIDNVIEKLDKVNSNVHIVFTCQLEHNPEKRPDKRKKIFKALTKFGTVKEFVPQFRNYETAKFIPIIQKIAKEKDVTITNEGAKLLVETAGVYLIDIDSQLEKLKLLIYPNKNITPDDIKKISIVNEDIFKVIDLITNNMKEEALAKIINILDKSHYLQILSMFQTFFTKFVLVKLHSNKKSTSEIAKLIGMTEGNVFVYQKKLQNITLEKLVQIKQNLSIAEYKLKSGEYQDPMLAFERILFGGKLC